MAKRDSTANPKRLLDPSRLPGQKTCPKCGETKPAAEFGVRRRKNRSGTVSVLLATRCKPCSNTDSRDYMRSVPNEVKAAAVRRLRETDPRGRILDRWSGARSRGSDITLEEYAEHYERNRMGCNPADWDAWMPKERTPEQAWHWWLTEGAPAEWLDAYWSAHPKPWNRPGLSDAEKYRTRYALDPEFNLRQRIRSQFKKLGLGGMSARRMRRKLGYGPGRFRNHIERQFARGMSWANYGEWHIDHIVPKSSFDLKSPEDVRACWCLSNLRPLWARDNMKKGAKHTLLC